MTWLAPLAPAASFFCLAFGEGRVSIGRTYLRLSSGTLAHNTIIVWERKFYISRARLCRAVTFLQGNRVRARSRNRDGRHNPLCRSLALPVLGKAALARNSD